jgi:hypothetical protein
VTIVILSVVAAAAVVAAFLTEGAFSGGLTLLGFVAGILLGGEWKEVTRMYRDSVQGEHHMPHPHPIAALRRMSLPSGVLVLTLVGVAQALVAALLIYVIIDFQSYQQCMSRWQQANGVALQVRADANEAGDAALDDIVLAVASSDPAALDAAVTEYIEVRQLQKEGRQKNPIPPLPQTVCGEVK